MENTSNFLTDDTVVFEDYRVGPKNILLGLNKSATPGLTGRKTHNLTSSTLNFNKQKSMIVSANPSGKMTVMNLKFTAKNARRSVVS